MWVNYLLCLCLASLFMSCWVFSTRGHPSPRQPNIPYCPLLFWAPSCPWVYFCHFAEKFLCKLHRRRRQKGFLSLCLYPALASQGHCLTEVSGQQPIFQAVWGRLDFMTKLAESYRLQKCFQCFCFVLNSPSHINIHKRDTSFAFK